MNFSAKFDSADLKADEYLGKGLTLDDVAKVTDKNGKVIYEAKIAKSESVITADPKNFKTAEDYVKAHSLYHGTPAKLEGNKLSFGKGGIKKGGQSGGLFLTDNPNSAKTFSFGGEIYQATPEIKNQVIDLTKKKV